MRTIRLLFLGSAVALAGCHTGFLPNPNDPKDVGSITIENVRDQLGSISDTLQLREAKQQIDDAQYHELMTEAADQLLAGVDASKIDVSKLWELADVMLTARHWSQAKPILEAAIRWAKENHNDDRWVNDSLRLAQVQARLGDVAQALKTARSVFGIQPSGAAPILYGALYDIAPVARGKGHDIELARLLEDAIVIDLGVYIDPQFQSGRDFLMARPKHIRNAWKLIHELYSDANRPDLEEQAHKRFAETGNKLEPEPPVGV